MRVKVGLFQEWFVTIFTTEVLIATETTEIFNEFLLSALSGNQCFSGLFATVYHNCGELKLLAPLSKTRSFAEFRCLG
jgi:hypothetical protein